MILPNPRHSASTAQTCPQAVERLTELVYELLDAHWETSRIGSDWELEDAWRAHLMYLRDLQRVARELLAYAGRSIGAEGGQRFPA